MHVVYNLSLCITLINFSPVFVGFEELWQQVIDMFAPWMQPLDNNGQILSPWTQAETDNAASMVRVFVGAMSELQEQFDSSLTTPQRNVPGLLFPHYATVLAKKGVAECVMSVYHSQLLLLHWEAFIPDTYAVGLMKQVV